MFEDEIDGMKTRGAAGFKMSKGRGRWSGSVTGLCCGLPRTVTPSSRFFFFSEVFSLLLGRQSTFSSALVAGSGVWKGASGSE